MKKLILNLIIALFLFIGCTTEKNDGIEGVWKMIYAEWVLDDSTTFYVPQEIEGGQIKAWLNGYVVLAGECKFDSVSKAKLKLYTNDSSSYDSSSGSYEAATYSLNGNKYEETFIYHDWTAPEGMTMYGILEINNDTLIQKFPADENWNLVEKYHTEIYVRLE
jgi:hypothetical protein